MNPMTPTLITVPAQTPNPFFIQKKFIYFSFFIQYFNLLRAQFTSFSVCFFLFGLTFLFLFKKKGPIQIPCPQNSVISKLNKIRQNLAFLDLKPQTSFHLTAPAFSIQYLELFSSKTSKVLFN
jgi:hypothetical protein